MSVLYRWHEQTDAEFLDKIARDKKDFNEYVGTNRAGSKFYIRHNSGVIAERSGQIAGGLFYGPWFGDDLDSSFTNTAHINYFIVKKDDGEIIGQLLDIYHTNLRNNHYEMSYANVKVENCFAMEVLYNLGYRYSEEIKDGERRTHYRLYKNL